MLAAIIFLVNSLLVSSPTPDQEMINSAIQQAGYSATYDASTGVIVVDPDENN